ncbi:hypothetical protein Taro_037741 [Colocasia esculenta]|uniref:Uncharacterized protein n=1 Tax=Colocasia esculenta TaxID=4460 RepID=A0A843WK62_COLES|nr:hypothetical protein [Colocasia esculenta]
MGNNEEKTTSSSLANEETIPELSEDRVIQSHTTATKQASTSDSPLCLDKHFDTSKLKDVDRVGKRADHGEFSNGSKSTNRFEALQGLNGEADINIHDLNVTHSVGGKSQIPAPQPTSGSGRKNAMHAMHHANKPDLSMGDKMDKLQARIRSLSHKH